MGMYQRNDKGVFSNLAISKVSRDVELKCFYYPNFLFPNTNIHTLEKSNTNITGLSEDQFIHFIGKNERSKQHAQFITRLSHIRTESDTTEATQQQQQQQAIFQTFVSLTTCQTQSAALSRPHERNMILVFNTYIGNFLKTPLKFV